MLAAFAPQVAACGSASTSGSCAASPRSASLVSPAHRRSVRVHASTIVTSQARLSRPRQGPTRAVPHAVASPTVFPTYTARRDVACRSSSLSGWTHGFGDVREAGGDETNELEANTSVTLPAMTLLTAFHRVAARIVAVMSAALTAAFAIDATASAQPPPSVWIQNTSRVITLVLSTAVVALVAHLLSAWPTVATVGPAAVFVSNGGLFGKLFASIGAIASESVTLGVATAMSTLTGSVGYSVAQQKASMELQKLRAEVAELREIVVDATKSAGSQMERSANESSQASVLPVQDVVKALGVTDRKEDTTVPESFQSSSARAKANAVWSPDDLNDAQSTRDSEVDDLLFRISTAEVNYTATSRTAVGTESTFDGTDEARSAKAAELHELRVQLARLRAMWSPELTRAPGTVEKSQPETVTDWAARAKANAVWGPELDVVSVGANSLNTEASPDMKVTDASSKQNKQKELAALRASLTGLRSSKREFKSVSVTGDDGSSPSPGTSPDSAGPSVERNDSRNEQVDYTAIARANAVWSPPAPRDYEQDTSGSDTHIDDGATAFLESGGFAGDESAELKRLEAEDAAWRRKLRMQRDVYDTV